MKNTKALVAVAAGLGLMGLALAAPASADTNVGSDTALVGVGSDTSQDVIEGFANALQGNLTNVVTITNLNSRTIQNVKATGSASAATRTATAANCTFTTRPNGSGDGLDGVSSSLQKLAFKGFTNAAGKPCVDFARSSSGGNPTVATAANLLTYIPFAVDEISFATLQTSSIVHNQNKSDLVAYYSANGTPGTGACLNAAPLLPQASSGTRKTFMTTFLGFASSAIGGTGAGSCTKDTNAAGTPIEENDGRFLVSSKNLIPYSVGVWIAQASGITADIRGRASLGSVDNNSAGVQGASPIQINPNGVFDRLLYNVVPTEATTGTGTSTNGFNIDATKELFVGSTSLLCSADGQKVVNAFGFASVPAGGISGAAFDCGSTTKKNT